MEVEMKRIAMKRRRWTARIWRLATTSCRRLERRTAASGRRRELRMASRRNKDSGWTLANGDAMRRGGLAQCMIDAKSDEDESARQGQIRARLKPLEGRAMFVEQCIRMRLNWLKARCGVRDYDALYDLCVILEGGGSVAPCASHVHHCIEFIPSSCRGEVCIYMASTHRYFRINMFDFTHVSCVEALMTHSSTKQTYAHALDENMSDCSVMVLTRRISMFRARCTRTLARCSLTRVCAVMCLFMLHMCSLMQAHSQCCAAQAAKS